MKKLILAAVCAVLLAASPLCAAQKNPVQKYSAHTLSENISTDVLALSMKDAIRTALSENITVRKASEDVTRARGDSKANSSALKPSVGITGSASESIENAFDGDAGDVRDAGLTASYTLYSGGKNKAIDKQGKLGVRKAEATLFDTKESVILSVWKAYCSVLYRKEVLAATADALDYYVKAEQEQAKRVELGASTNLDLTRIRQQRENARANHIAAGNNLESSQVALCRLLQISPKTRLELTDDLSDGLPDKDSMARGTEKDFLDAYNNSLTHRGDYQALLAQQESDQKEITVAASGLKPTVSVSGGYGWDYQNYTDKELDRADEWSAKLSTSIPLYDGGSTSGKTASAKSKYEQSKLAVSDKEEEIKTSLIDARLTLVNALETAGASRAAVEYARQSLRYAEVGYREGVNTQLDLIQARTDLTDAKRSLAEYLYECRAAQASMWREEGRLAENTIGAAALGGGAK